MIQISNAGALKIRRVHPKVMMRMMDAAASMIGDEWSGS
jgi:hypothetical protein